MLLRFRVSNFRSLRDEQELSMVAVAKDERGSAIHVEDLGLDVLRVSAIYGANAAGKSNVLAALKFLRDAVVRSHRSWRPDGPIPREPFLLDPEARSAPSLFEVDFLLEGVRFRYGFRIDDEQVLAEWLYTYPHKRPQLWFERDARASQPFKFGKQVRGNYRIISELTRKNSLFLSAAAENNHPALTRIFLWIGRLRFDFARNEGDTLFFLDEGRHQEALLGLVRLADLGILDLRLKEDSPRDPFREVLSLALRGADDRVAEDAAPYGAPPVIELVHKAGDGGVPLPFHQESGGTRAWFALAGPILRTLEQGGLLCIDELDASLHPRLALEVIRMFEDPVRNPRKAQLIFNTHDTTLLGNLLGAPGLRRDQVWFVEKDEAGATHLYPLTEFKPRKSENLERGYLQGRYGAMPFIEPSVLVEDDEKT